MPASPAEQPVRDVPVKVTKTKGEPRDELDSDQNEIETAMEKAKLQKMARTNIKHLQAMDTASLSKAQRRVIASAISTIEVLSHSLNTACDEAARLARENERLSCGKNPRPRAAAPVRPAAPSKPAKPAKPTLELSRAE